METIPDEVEDLAESLKDLIQEGAIKIAWTDDGNTKYLKSMQNNHFNNLEVCYNPHAKSTLNVVRAVDFF